MSFLDWGRNLFNNLPIVGGLTSSIWGDPDQERVQDAYKQSQQDLAKQRAYNMDARTNMMNQGALAFGPRNQMLGQMMGMQGPAMDLSQILKNPMSQAQQDDIRNSAFPQQPTGGGFQVPPPGPPSPRGTGASMGQGSMGLNGMYGRGNDLWTRGR